MKQPRQKIEVEKALENHYRIYVGFQSIILHVSELEDLERQISDRLAKDAFDEVEEA